MVSPGWRVKPPAGCYIQQLDGKGSFVKKGSFSHIDLCKKPADYYRKSVDYADERIINAYFVRIQNGFTYLFERAFLFHP